MRVVGGTPDGTSASKREGGVENFGHGPINFYIPERFELRVITDEFSV